MPEISYLLSEVESRYGRRIETSTDFESLSIVIEHTIGEMISASTLKRLWGYVSLNPTPRIATLNVLARFAGLQVILRKPEGFQGVRFDLLHIGISGIIRP